MRELGSSNNNTKNSVRVSHFWGPKSKKMVSASSPEFWHIVFVTKQTKRQGGRLVELTTSFMVLLQRFSTAISDPIVITFTQIIIGWIPSPRRRFISDIIFTGGNVGKGHWARFHRFFSHASWKIDDLSLILARLVVDIFSLGAEITWAVDDTLCRKRGLNVYGAGMHHDPLISSKAKPLVSSGHDWVVLCIVINKPFWAPTKSFALPIAQFEFRTFGDQKVRKWFRHPLLNFRILFLYEINQKARRPTRGNYNILHGIATAIL